MTYANGRAPESALVLVDGVHMVPSIVARVRAFIAYGAGNGHTLHVAKPFGGYRTLAEQAEVSGGGGSSVSVAAPGHSTHGNYDIGRVDLVGANGHSYTPPELSWMISAAGHFGLTREFGASDPNHFMAVGGFASVGPVTPVTPPAPDPIQENQHMTDIIYYAHGAASAPTIGPDGKTGYVVQPESMWYQECPGAPLFALTNDAGYTTGAFDLEWLAFATARPNTADLLCTPDQVASLLKLRGFAPKPIGNFTGSSSVSTSVNLQPVLDGQGQILSAVEALKFPTKITGNLS